MTAPRPTVLVTGFVPYRDGVGNPSECVVRDIDGSDVAGCRVAGVVLAVSGAQVRSQVERAIRETEPVAVLMLGAFPGRPALSVERVAVNVADFPFADNDGEQLADARVIESGPDAYLSTAPVKAVASAWREHEIPGYVSDTAGTYVCNQAFYVALHATAGSRVPVGFVHLPSLPADAARAGSPTPSLTRACQAEGVRVALSAVLATRGGPTNPNDTPVGGHTWG